MIKMVSGHVVISLLKLASLFVDWPRYCRSVATTVHAIKVLLRTLSNKIHQVQQDSAELKPDSYHSRHEQQALLICLSDCDDKIFVFVVTYLHSSSTLLTLLHFLHNLIIFLEMNVFIYCFKRLFIIPCFVSKMSYIYKWFYFYDIELQRCQ